MVNTCLGCHEQFERPSDFVQHLRRSTRPVCQAARRTFEQSVRPTRNASRRSPPRRHSSTSSTQSQTSVPRGSTSPTPQPPSHFAGDYFGTDYTNTDFPFPENDDEVDVNVHGAGGVVDEADLSDDEGSEAGIEDHQPQEKVWEPPRPQTSSPAPVESTHGSPMNVDNDDAPPEHQHPAVATHDHLRQVPAYVQHFGRHAGAPIFCPGADVATGYDAYAQTVDESRANPWAPFVSRLDWEVAQWAKLRGSGSTAFSDLLAIEGVSSLLYGVI